MILECSHCGAPLNIKDGESLARCGYCDNSQQVRNMNTISAVTPESWQQPAQWTPPANARVQAAQALLFKWAEAQAQAQARAASVAQARMAQRSKGGFGLGCAAVLLVLAVGVAVAVMNAGGPSRLMSRVESDGLDPEATPTLGLVTIGESRFERTMSGTTNGSVSLPGFFGEYPAAPSANLRVQGRQLLILSTHSQDDTALLLRGANNVQRYDDDGGDGQDARLVLSLDPGIYRIWVGSRSVGQVFDLHFSSRVVDGQLNADGLVPEGPPTAGQVTLDANSAVTLAQGMEWRTTVEDEVETRHCGSHVAPVPNVIVHVTTPTRVTFATRSDFDATLLVRDSGGAYTCDDDSGDGNNAQLTVTLPVGDSAIWAGMRIGGPAHDILIRMTVESDEPEPSAHTPGRASRHRSTDRKRNR